MGLHTKTIVLIFQAFLTFYFVDDASTAEVRDFKEYNPKDFQHAVLDEVNKRRAQHQVPPLYLSDDLNDRAMKCARTYADTKSMATKCPWRGPTSENTHFADPGHTKSNYTAFAQSVVVTWYNELAKIDYKNPIINHGTRMLWKNIRELGFGMALGGDVKIPKYLAISFLVFPDNIKKDQAKENIFKPQ